MKTIASAEKESKKEKNEEGGTVNLLVNYCAQDTRWCKAVSSLFQPLGTDSLCAWLMLVEAGLDGLTTYSVR